MKRGDVVLALFPNSDLITAKIRPALVVQRDSLQCGLPQVVLAAITSQMSRTGHPSRVTVLVNSPAGRAAGLITDSVVMTDNLATVNVSVVSRVIGSLPMPDVDAALRSATGSRQVAGRASLSRRCWNRLRLAWLGKRLSENGAAMCRKG